MQGDISSQNSPIRQNEVEQGTNESPKTGEGLTAKPSTNLKKSQAETSTRNG